MQVCWDDPGDDEWDAALDAAGGGALQQSAAYARAMGCLGAHVRRGVLREGGRDVAVVQVIERRGLRLVLRGPVWTADCNRRRALCALARHAGAVVATPEEPLSGLGLVPLVTPRHHAIWSLDAPPDALRATLDPRWRNRLAAAERAGLVIGRNRKGALDSLIEGEARLRSTRGYRALPAAFTQALATTSPEDLIVLDWRQQGAVRAAIAIIRHGRGATYHLAWADDIARRTGVHQAMLWQAAMHLRAHGVRRFDLGDVNTETASGLAHFKLGTGAALHRLGATLWVLPG